MNSTSLDTILQIAKWVANTFFHQCVAVLAVYTIWVPIQNYSTPFSWHVILCSLGILPIMAECLILFSNSNVWSQEIEIKQKYWIHGILISIGAIFVVTGIAVEIYRKAIHPNPSVVHFESAHSIFGLLSLIVIVFAVILGLSAFNSQKFIKWTRPIWLKLAHNVIGQLTFLLCIITLCLGYYLPWFIKYTSVESRILATVVTLVVAVWSLAYAWKALYNQIISIIN